MSIALSERVVERFFDRFIPEPTSGCWLWTAAVGGEGINAYGRLLCGDKVHGAHRVSYEIHHGPIPDGMLVCHKCDVPSCVNPDHLFLGTDADNAHDRDRKGRGRYIGAPPRPGSRNQAAKLTEADVLELRRRVASGRATVEQEARRLGIHRVNAYRIVRGATWRHVPVLAKRNTA